MDPESLFPPGHPPRGQATAHPRGRHPPGMERTLGTRGSLSPSSGAGTVAGSTSRVERLNLGSGLDVRPGWVNLDAFAPGADVRHDLERLPLPFADETFDHVLASHILEHIPHRLADGGARDGLVRLLEEIHRILKPGGTLEAAYPHPARENAYVWGNPEHTRVLSPRTWRAFDPEAAETHSLFTTARFRLESLTNVRRLAGPVGYVVARHLGERAKRSLDRLGRLVEQRVVVRKVAMPSFADVPQPQAASEA